MVWVKLRYWKFEQLLSSKLSWASPFLSCSPSSCFSCSTALLFCIRKRTNSTNEGWIDQQKNVCRVLKCTLRSLSVLHERPDTNVTHKHEVWNDSHFMCLLFQASKQTFYILNIDCCFESTGIYKVLHHNEIFRVNDAKARPRLNTGSVLYPHTVEKLTV